MTDKPNFLPINLDQVILDADTGCNALWIDKHFKTKGIPTPPEEGLLPVMTGDSFVGWAEPDWLPMTRRHCAEIDWIAVSKQLAADVLAVRG